MRQTRIHLYLLFLFALVATACGGSSDQQEPVIDLNEMFPSNFSIVNNTVWRFDVNLDGLKEWLVLYQDLSVTNFEGRTLVRHQASCPLCFGCPARATSVSVPANLDCGTRSQKRLAQSWCFLTSEAARR
jgi:hypothetical protein